MLHRIIAAFFLLPASFVVFWTGMVLLSAFRPLVFFRQGHQGRSPACQKRSRLFNLLVFYPMRAGIEIVHRKDLKFVVRAALRVCLRPVERQLASPP